MQLGELRLVVEEVDVGRRAVLEQVDDPLGLRREVADRCEQLVLGRPEGLLAEQRGQGGDTDAGGALAEEVAAVDEILMFEAGMRVQGESTPWSGLRRC